VRHFKVEIVFLFQWQKSKGDLYRVDLSGSLTSSHLLGFTTLMIQHCEVSLQVSSEIKTNITMKNNDVRFGSKLLHRDLKVTLITCARSSCSFETTQVAKWLRNSIVTAIKSKSNIANVWAKFFSF